MRVCASKQVYTKIKACVHCTHTYELNTTIVTITRCTHRRIVIIHVLHVLWAAICFLRFVSFYRSVNFCRSFYRVRENYKSKLKQTHRVLKPLKLSTFVFWTPPPPPLVAAVVANIFQYFYLFACLSAQSVAFVFPFPFVYHFSVFYSLSASLALPCIN